MQRNLLRLGTLARRMQCVSCGFITYQVICSGLVYSIYEGNQTTSGLFFHTITSTWNFWIFNGIFSCQNSFFLSHIFKKYYSHLQKKIALVSPLPCASLFELQQHYQKFVKILELLLFELQQHHQSCRRITLSLFFWTETIIFAGWCLMNRQGSLKKHLVLFRSPPHGSI